MHLHSQQPGQEILLLLTQIHGLSNRHLHIQLIDALPNSFSFSIKMKKVPAMQISNVLPSSTQCYKHDTEPYHVSKGYGYHQGAMGNRSTTLQQWVGDDQAAVGHTGMHLPTKMCKIQNSLSCFQ